MKVPGYDKEIDFGFLLDFAYKIDGLGNFIIYGMLIYFLKR